MSGPSKVIVLDPDARASRQVQLGFEREGVPTAIAQIPLETAKLELPGDDAGLVVVGGADGKALELLRRARALLEDGHIDAPIVFAGRGVRRTDAEAAGADEVVLQPAYLRDVVTIGRLLRGIPANQRDHLVGNLAETTGVFTLVRALAALGRSATLTLIRGLRRGEVRFYHGEVTSAQVGLIHGQAALHQLLLWTDARFDFHHEDVVRRQQIPLAPDELWADAERFLEGVRDSSGGLSPAMVLEQDVQRVQGLGKQIPTEVHGVLRMFDGHRMLADVLEDSQYRVFETLRVAQRAVEAGLLRVVEKQKPKTTWRAVLAIEEWLVGTETREDVIERTTIPDSGPISARESQRLKKKKPRRKKKRPQTPLPIPSKADIDWGALVPRIVGADLGPLAGVVPASHTSGEIEMPSRDREREKLEALMDTDKRGKIFPTEIGLEPSVVFDDQAETTSFERVEATPPPTYAADAGSVIKDALARQQRDREEAESRARADEVRVRAEAAEWTRQEAAARAAAEASDAAAAERAQSAASAHTQAEADALARRIAEARGARPDPEVEAKDRAEADARAWAEAAEAARASEARDAATGRARARAEAEARARAEAETAREAEETAAAEQQAAREQAEQAAREAQARADAQARAEADAAHEAQARADAQARAEADARAEAAREAQAAADAAAAAAAEAKARADTQARAAAETADRAEAEAWELAAAEAARRTPAAEPSLLRAAPESEAASTTTAKLTAEPIVQLAPPSAEEANLVATPRTMIGEIQAAVAAEVPAAVIDAPSDGVIVQHIATLDTAPVARRPSSVPPIDDRPEDATGEITTPRKMAPTAPPKLAEPSILVTDLASEVSEPVPPPAVEPLVADLAAAHVAIAAVATVQAAAKPSADASTTKQTADVAAARKDVQVFSEAEEDFFRAGQDKTAKPAPPGETFEDLDEGYQPVGFWDRVRGRKPKR